MTYDMRRCRVDEIIPLRHAVLRPGRPVETAHFDKDELPTTHHYGLFLQGEPLVCLSLLQSSLSGAEVAGVVSTSEIASAALSAATLSAAKGVSAPGNSYIGESASALSPAGIPAENQAQGLSSTQPTQLKAWQLRGMATAEVSRGSGLGSRLLQFALLDVQSESYSRIFWCNARLRAVPFYERNGWVVISDEFDVPGIGPHFKMVYGKKHEI